MRGRISRRWVYNAAHSPMSAEIRLCQFPHEESSMKRILPGCAVWVLSSLLISTSFAQQPETPKTPNPTPNAKKQATQPSPSEKAPEAAIKPETAPEQKPAIQEASAEKQKEKEEHFDMT